MILLFKKPLERSIMRPARKLNSAVKLGLFTLLFVFTLAFSSAVPVKQAQARCCLCCPSPILAGYHALTITTMTLMYTTTFDTLRDNLLSQVWWYTGLRPLFSSMAQELVAGGWYPVMEFGAQTDGRLQNETVLQMQIMSAKATKRHLPSASMCKFASLNKSMAQADMRAKMVHNVLNEYSLRRKLGQSETIGASKARDTQSRLKTSLEQHCDRREFGGEMSFLCGAGTGSNGRTSKDINYTNTVDAPDTIHMSVDSGINVALNQSEITDVMAIKSLLYNNELAPRVDSSALNWDYSGSQSAYINWRSTQAKRSVAENSFDALIGMKAASGIAVTDQYKAQLRSLGVSATETDLQTKIAPSYWAQMEHLTKSIYQNTNFFVNLYDNPANVARQSASMEAISLMQLRDYYESLIRSEMSLALLLDTEVAQEQKALNNVVSQWGY
jgi:hypothetical protein